MGSILTRHLRDLGDVGGFETLDGSVSYQPDSLPCTPSAKEPIRVLNFDPRSPTAEIVRTPIEVASKFSQLVQDSPMASVLQSHKSYLETDLDTLSTSESAVKPQTPSYKDGPSLPPGLSGAHLMKLRFLGVDPRSPSNNVVRTPIQSGKGNQKSISPIHFDDTLSIGSVSSQDLFNNSICSSEFTRDCSDPSAFISEIGDESDIEDEETHAIPDPSVKIETPSEEISVRPSTMLKEQKPNDGLPKTTGRLQVFQENEDNESDEKALVSTPEGTKKSAASRARTPLTPIGNRTRTPNSILRAKQTQTLEKEMLAKVKIFATDDVITPSKIRPLGSSKKENFNGRSGRKVLATNNENANSATKKQALAQWDQDTSVII